MPCEQFFKQLYFEFLRGGGNWKRAGAASDLREIIYVLLQWKQRKYMRIIVNLILIQMPFILLRMPKYIHENGWIILHDSNSIGTSLKSTSSLLTVPTFTLIVKS